MTTVRLCKECGARLPADAPEGLCPQCLMKQGVASQSGSSPEPKLESPDDTTTVSGLGGQAGESPIINRQSPIATLRYFGDYELLEEIARGGMGVVYKARQVSLNRIVAVKMILAGQLASEAEVKRFRTEAEAAAQLQHPNIVAVHEVGEHLGQHYFSMDFVVGTSLAARLGSEPLPIGEAVRWMKTIAEAVHFAHQRGIVHRDLKPANVLMDEFNRPRITDFGLAKRLDRAESITASGAIFGTPNYMSPEQAAGRQDIIGPAGDVFSLGAMLYEMITGRVPFHGSNLAETLSNILRKDPAPPGRLNPRVPPDLETICLKCLEKRSDWRYPTADALAKDLGRFLNHEAISARSASTSRKASRWLVSHPKILAALASGLLLALVWLGYGLWSENRLLAWEKDHPTEWKPASAWSSDQQSWWRLTVALIFLVAGLQDLLAKQTRKRVLTGRFIPPRVLSAFGLAGLGGAALSVYVGAAGIESWRWANHALPLAHARLTTEAAANAKLEQLRISEASQNEELKKVNQELDELGKQLTNAPRAGIPAIVEQLGTKLRQQTALIKSLVSASGEASAQLIAKNGRLLSGLSNPKQFEIKTLEKTAGMWSLGWFLSANALSVWICATLTLGAFRERRFAFYLSAQDEQTALSQAMMEQERTQAAEEARRIRTIRFLLIPVSLLLLNFPLFYWGQDEELSRKVVLLLGAAGAYLLALIASLQSWRSASRWHTLNRALLVLSALCALVALLHGPASLVGRGIGFGFASGAVLGSFIRWTRKRKSA
ncbi:MAG: serine/threonine-protein kinase [Limisphaerales bacterium]